MFLHLAPDMYREDNTHDDDLGVYTAAVYLLPCHQNADKSTAGGAGPVHLVHLVASFELNTHPRCPRS